VLDHDYPISAIYHDTPRYPLGATVLPGEYKVILSVGGKSVTQTLEVKMDPRVKTSPADLRRQFDLDRKIADALHRDYEALQQVRSLRTQLKALTAGSNQAAGAATAGSKERLTAIMANELEAKAAPIEGQSGGYGARYLSTPAGRSLSRLNSGFNALVSALDTADAAPTTQQITVFAELNKALDEQLSAWAQLKSKEIPELNEQLKKARQPMIDLQKPAPGAPEEDDSQDRD
jgi:hypothetical protein